MAVRGDCKHIPNCPLFALFKIKSFMSIWQISYCRGDWTACARYKLSERGETAPVNLLPNGELLGAAPRHP
jgi:hypothetical protein